ncbi:MAG: DUF1643 domain-containing protein [Kiritimatiellaeota bacterium]|nr:DUF1643 domain-containing protein [Kiritimatiellota bacterium]
MNKDAIISPCGKYRYALWRIWNNDLPLVMFIGLNPSKADDKVDDSTIRRCVSFAQSWQYGGLSMGNLFALRATKTDALWQSEDPIGPDNDMWLRKLRDKAQLVIAAWGDDGQYKNRDQVVTSMFPTLHCLKLSAKGNPRHPLYLSGDLKPKEISKNNGQTVQSA